MKIFFKTNFYNLLGILFLILSIISCEEPSCKRFLDNYSAEDFTMYENKGIAIRGYDNNDHSILLFIDSDVSGSKNDGPYIIKINEKSGKVIGTSTHLMVDTSDLNKDLLQKLAVRFLSYKIRSLKVDGTGNVFVGIKANDRPDLIRFSNEKSIDKFNLNGWVQIKNSWYMRR